MFIGTPVEIRRVVPILPLMHDPQTFVVPVDTWERAIFLAFTNPAGAILVQLDGGDNEVVLQGNWR